MTTDITPEVEEVIALAESGTLLRDPKPQVLGDVRVTHSVDDLQAWLFTEAQPGARDEDGRDWLNLRELMVSKIRYSDAETRGLAGKALDELERSIARRIEHGVHASLQGGPFLEYQEDIAADLTHCALARAVGSTGDHAALFERLFEAYKVGVFPCGWEGTYPAGRLAVFVPTSEDRAGG